MSTISHLAAVAQTLPGRLFSLMFRIIEAVGTYALWAFLVAVVVLAYIYAPRFTISPGDPESAPTPRP